MIAVDDGRWPLVTVSRAGRFTIADATAQLIAFDNLLRRHEPFALVLTDEDAEAASGAADPGALTIWARWLEANHDLLHAWCRGIALIGPLPEDVDPQPDPLAAAGIPHMRFPAAESAEGWLAARLAEPAESVDA